MSDSIAIFEDYLETQPEGTPIWFSVLDYSKILCESLERDFNTFYERHKLYVIPFGGILNDDMSYEIPLGKGYSLVLSTEDRKIRLMKIHYYSSNPKDNDL